MAQGLYSVPVWQETASLAAAASAGGRLDGVLSQPFKGENPQKINKGQTPRSRYCSFGDIEPAELESPQPRKTDYLYRHSLWRRLIDRKPAARRAGSEIASRNPPKSPHHGQPSLP